MNKEFNQNTRTLIVSFVFAIMIMVPLRFIEINNVVIEPLVLGVSTEIVVPKVEHDCLSREYVKQVVINLTDSVEIEKFVSRMCK